MTSNQYATGPDKNMTKEINTYGFRRLGSRKLLPMIYAIA